MYYVQDAHSFWDWIYFVLLIVVSNTHELIIVTKNNVYNENIPSVVSFVCGKKMYTSIIGSRKQKTKTRNT